MLRYIASTTPRLINGVHIFLWNKLCCFPLCVKRGIELRGARDWGMGLFWGSDIYSYFYGENSSSSMILAYKLILRISLHIGTVIFYAFMMKKIIINTVHPKRFPVIHVSLIKNKFSRTWTRFEDAFLS